MMNVSLDTANINAINISTQAFRILQNFNSNWTTPYLQKLTNVPEVPVAQLYTNVQSPLVNLFTHLPSTRIMMKTHPSYGQS